MRPLPKRSLAGLNAANFFQAEMVVILPVLSAFLKEANSRYDSIGCATAAAGLGTVFMAFVPNTRRQQRPAAARTPEMARNQVG